MGGGGSYYDRDVTSSRLTSDRGFSSVAEASFQRSKVNAAVLPKDRRLTSTCASPVVYAFDVTGSMQTLPKVIFDKMPGIAGQLAMQKYLRDPQVSLVAVGDVTSDSAPVQVCDFSAIKKLDDWLSRLFLEGQGGGQHYESYEFIAYYYARLYTMKNGVTPIFLFTGDEGFRETLSAGELSEHFGGQHQDVQAADIFKELRKKFKGNVFLLHRRYADPGLNREITAQWQKVLGKENVIELADDKAVGDTTLGILAIASGARTLEEYLKDIRTRPLNLGNEKFEPQSEERINQVRESLKAFAASRKPTGKRRSAKSSRPKKGSGAKKENWEV